MGTAIRAFFGGAVALGLATLIIANSVASIPDPSLEGVMFLPLMFGLAIIGGALFGGSMNDYLAFCGGAVTAAVLIVVAWSRLHVDAVELVVWWGAFPTAVGAGIGSGTRTWFIRGKRSWEAFRDEAKGM